MNLTNSGFQLILGNLHEYVCQSFVAQFNDGQIVPASLLIVILPGFLSNANDCFLPISPTSASGRLVPDDRFDLLTDYMDKIMKRDPQFAA